MRVFALTILVPIALSSSCAQPCGAPAEPTFPLLSVPLDGAAPPEPPPATVTGAELVDGVVQVDVDDGTYPQGFSWGVLDGTVPLLPAVDDVLTVRLSLATDGSVAYARVLDATGTLLVEGGNVQRDGGGAATGQDIDSVVRFQGVTDEVLCGEEDGRTRFRATAGANLDGGLADLTPGEPLRGASSGRRVQVFAHEAIHLACPDTNCTTSDLVIGGAYALVE